MSSHEALATACHWADVDGFEVVVIDPENLWPPSGAAFTDEARSTTAKVRVHNAGVLACQLDSEQPGCREVRVPAFALVVAVDTAARNVTRNRNRCRDANEQSG